jgi:hypothetical protein
MVDQVQIPHSVVVDKVPLPAEIIVGGLAANLTDFRLYSKGYDGVVIRLSGRVEITDDNVTNALVYLPWVKAGTGNVLQYVSSTKLSFNPATGQLSATSFAGSGAGLTGFTAAQINDALGFSPAEAVGQELPPEATDLPTALTLLNSMRAAAVSSGVGS